METPFAKISRFLARVKYGKFNGKTSMASRRNTFEFKHMVCPANKAFWSVFLFSSMHNAVYSPKSLYSCFLSPSICTFTSFALSLPVFSLLSSIMSTKFMQIQLNHIASPQNSVKLRPQTFPMISCLICISTWYSLARSTFVRQRKFFIYIDFMLIVYIKFCFWLFTFETKPHIIDTVTVRNAQKKSNKLGLILF